MTRFCPNLFWLLCLTCMLLPCVSRAQLQINNVSSTPSFCPNNGTITVDATTTSPPILYSIISGPRLAPVQTASIFGSLPSGTYTVKVTDGASNSATRAITITGNYVPPDMSPIVTTPFCAGGSDGRIVGNWPWWMGGVGPFSWELITPSPVIRGPQENDTFPNLPAGNYSLRLTDGCGGFRTVVVTLPDPPPANFQFYGVPRVSMRGCDSAYISIQGHVDVFRLPFTCTFTTSAGTFTTTTPTQLDTASWNVGTFEIGQVIPHFTYGDFYQIKVTDSCGATYTSPTYTSKQFVFCPDMLSYYDGCDYKTDVVFDMNSGFCNGTGMPTYPKFPLTYEIKDQATNAVVQTDTVESIYDNNGNTVISGFRTKALAGNKNYNITVKDSCGRSYAQSFFVTQVLAPPPRISNISKYQSASCLDSTARVSIQADYFKQHPRLIILSGPAKLRSTKPGYAYESTYAYPDTMEYTGWGGYIGSNVSFDIIHLAVGTYQFKVIDSCGSEVAGSFVIQPADVADLHHQISYKKGCLGKNEIHYTVAHANGYMNIRNLTGMGSTFKYYTEQAFDPPIVDSVMNLPTGTYEISFTHMSLGNNASQPGNYNILPCTVTLDTIVIEGYQTPAIIAHNYIQCKTSTYLELLADSSKGVSPFEYEIISGPQLYPMQPGNSFTAAQPGTYTARIYDVCGNASTAQITVSPITFPPLAALSSSCTGRLLTYGKSVYSTYVWKAPDGTVYTADTLNIDPVTIADTGIYNIQKITNINGCRDTVYTTYHLALENVYEKFDSICPGKTIVIGAHTYNSTGIYFDTLTSIRNCDSIIMLHLTVLPLKRDSIYRTICPGSQFLFNGKAYDIAGFYSDTLSTATCDSVATLVLSVTIKKDSINRSICENGQYNFNGRLLTATGVYRDTLPTATCDSIAVLNLTVLPFKRSSLSKTICEGAQFHFNGQFITTAGTYSDTLSTATCDSIVQLNLSVVAPTLDVIANPQTVIFPANTVQLHATAAHDYVWNGGGVTISNTAIDNPLATLTASAWIYVQAKSTPDDCLMKDSVFITVVDRSTFCADASIYIPTAFTPNRDGRNDIFRILGNKVSLKSFRIFNRWGEQVFFTSDIATGWDGSYKGKMLPATYVYTIVYTDCMGETKTMSGTVVLIL